MSQTNQANRNYTFALLGLGFLLLLAAGGSIILAQKHAPSAPSRPALEMVSLVGFFFILLISTTLALRGCAPAIGRAATIALNCLLIFSFPFGTAIAVYGFLKVDKLPLPPLEKSAD